jgi:hypothetical protein
MEREAFYEAARIRASLTKPAAGGLNFSARQQRLIRTDPISVRFHRLGPWFTQFTFGRNAYGGTNCYAGDVRLNDFFEWLDVEGSLVELGSFEAGHTLILAKRPAISSILGVDGRAYLLERSEFIRELYAEKKMSFRLCNFETEPLRGLGRFNIAFCSGLLYHLTKPWSFLQGVATIASRFFLSTHYALKELESEGEYQGEIYPEYGYNEPCSGLADYSFRLSLRSLRLALLDAGFEIIHEHDITTADNGPVVNMYCRVVRGRV